MWKTFCKDLSVLGVSVNDFHQQQKHNKFKLPKIHDLGLKQKEEIEQLFKMTELPREGGHHGEVPNIQKVPNDSDNGRGIKVSKVNVQDLYNKNKEPRNVFSNKHENVSAEDDLEERRVEELKAKYLRTKHKSTFSYKL